MSKHILHHEDIPDGAGLKESYGPTVPNPKGVSPGSVVNFGWLAGTGEIRPARSTHFEDSIHEQYRNLPGAHAKVGGEGK